MASQNDMFGELDENEEYLTVIAKEAKEALLDRKLKEMQKKNKEILRRHAEVEADRKAAEDSGCSVAIRSSNANFSDQDRSYEVQRPSEDEIKGRGRGQTWGRRRPRGPRTRPHSYFAQGSQRDNHTTEFESSHNSSPDKLVSTGLDPDRNSSPRDCESGQSPQSSHQFTRSFSHPQYGSQELKDGNRGQRSAGGRGHSRPKFVTVPAASHSHDVRHVEEVNDSIVINIDCSSKPLPEPARRGRGGRGGTRGTGAKNDLPAVTMEDGFDSQVVDRDGGNAHGDMASLRGGYRGRGNRRPFRGHGDGSYRGQGRGDGGFRRGRGDGPRPFRGGYRGDRARGGRGARRAVIHVVTSSGSGVGSSCVQEEENWDKETAVAGPGATGTDDADDHGWPCGEDGGAVDQEEHQNPDDFEDGDGHLYDEPLASGVCDKEDGDDLGYGHDGKPDDDVGEKTEPLSETKENGGQDVKTAENKERLPGEVKESLSSAKSKEAAKDLVGVKSDDGVGGNCGDLKQKSVPSAETAKADIKVPDDASSHLPEVVKDASSGGNSRPDSVVGNTAKDISNQTTDPLKEKKADKSSVIQPPNAAESGLSAANKSESKATTLTSAEVSKSSEAPEAGDKDLPPVLSSAAVSEIPLSVSDKKT